jgi:sterol desaturase/sphingolipid hydroxylase (fatty acid hydroxylase superfamily)
MAGLWAGAILVVGVLEVVAPWRATRGAFAARWLRHLSLGAVNVGVRRAALPVLGIGVAASWEQAGLGLLHGAQVPWPVACLLSLALLDLTDYLWHRLLHASPLLWRVHRVHHTDSDFDLTTALRVHPLEEVAGGVVRLGAIAALGPPVAALVLFELCSIASAVGGHANARLPTRVEAAARTLLLVTPDLHRIHHSARADEANSNFGNLFLLWDRLFRTLRREPASGQDGLEVGDPAFRQPREQTLAGMLLHPFRV